MKTAYSYVRFSSAKQAKGDSLRRQIKGAEDYAKSHGLILDTTLKADKGVSAYDKSNVTKGHLGVFLAKVEAREIARGSVLIVESLDRLSRSDILTALELFTRIIRKGIKIVTLTDGREYDTESITENPMDLHVSLMIMHRANEESKTKGLRVGSAWQKKRDKALDGHKLTSICPGWLERSADKKSFKIIPDRAKLVRRIYTLARDGHGQGVIAHRLNSEGVAPWGRGKKKGRAWHSSYICKILTNRSVIGEYQPHTQPKGEKRKPVGVPIEDYFPSVVDSKLFYEVQRLRNGRKKAGLERSGSRLGKLSNLFSGLATCGYCGATMGYHDKGDGCRYLVCNSAQSGTGCRRLSVPYDKFEQDFLLMLSDCNNLSSDSERTDTDLVFRLSALEGELQSIDQQLERLATAIRTTDQAPTILVEQINKLEGREPEVVLEIEGLKAEISSGSSAGDRRKDLSNLLIDTLNKNNKLQGRELQDYRTRLASRIASVVTTVKIYSRDRELHAKQVELLEGYTGRATEIVACKKLVYGGWSKYVARRPLVFAVELVDGDQHLFVRPGVVKMPKVVDGGERIPNAPTIIDITGSKTKNSLRTLY